MAVVLVVVYHLFPGWWLRSGFIGVDVFFVISGFLITSLRCRERERTGRIALVDFWRRRARRLLPALALLVTVTATWAWMIGGDVLVRLGWQVAGAITFSYNWVSVAGGSDYFTAGTPELLRNLWSLAVEEQFYLVWPLLLLVLLFLPRRWARAAAALAAAVASAWWMAAVVSGGGGLTRAYFGTDTHAFGLLLGVALAVGLQRVLTAPPAWMLRTGARATGAAVGTVALAGLFAIALLPEQPDTITFPGTLAAASVLTAIVIVAGTAAGSALGPALDAGPLRWIGDRSYSIYLWHWPLLVLIAAMTGRTAGSDPLPAWIGGLVLVLTVLCAAASHRFVEQPVRRYGFRGSLRRLHRHLVGPPGARLRAIGVLVGGAAVIAGTTAAIQVAPAESSAQSVVQAGQRALEQDAGPRPPLLAADQADHPSGGAAPAAVTGAQIDAIGDSVMLASAPALMQALPRHPHRCEGLAVDVDRPRTGGCARPRSRAAPLCRARPRHERCDRPGFARSRGRRPRTAASPRAGDRLCRPVVDPGRQPGPARLRRRPPGGDRRRLGRRDRSAPGSAWPGTASTRARRAAASTPAPWPTRSMRRSARTPRSTSRWCCGPAGSPSPPTSPSDRPAALRRSPALPTASCPPRAPRRRVRRGAA
ncbi:acyltransferase family protein [Microbacterium elymi]|uniref:Acyltransferase n=1 Tax=Microbacterium elymi TaxID=2909587 RepID=A0ABY5NLA5_9MICO|nr:acyltransferase family protein [Microbacterium elymi]UUT35896.1 acyltransferase [Microbacterium elymi]